MSLGKNRFRLRAFLADRFIGSAIKTIRVRRAPTIYKIESAKGGWEEW